jgi:dihydrofolate reductase
VISSNSKLSQNENVKQAGSLDDALQLSKSLNENSKIYVIGGSKVYEQALSDCRFIY